MYGLIVQFAMAWESSDREPLCSRWFAVPGDGRAGLKAEAILSGRGGAPVRRAA